MKKFVSIIVAMAVICMSLSAFCAQPNDLDKITVTMNGENMVFDVEPFIANDRVLVPFRAIFEALGCNVTYTVSEGKQFATAIRGDSSVIVEIGADDVQINGNTEKLDVPALIKDGRTLVPVYVISKSFGASVKWLGTSRTVEITTKQGQHKITHVTAQEDIKAEDGTKFITIAYTYPVIDNPDNNAYISYINNEYKEYAQNFVEDAKSNLEDAKLLREQKGEYFSPLEFDLSYEVQTDRKDILSITNYCFYDLGGAHPNTTRQSRTFDIANQKELVLADVVNGNDDERHTMVYDVFVKYFEENYEDFSKETAEIIDDEADNVKFYLTDSSLVLYFDVYQVASYAMQYPTVELSYTPGLFKIDLSDKKVEPLPSDVSLDNLNEHTLAVGFDASDIYLEEDSRLVIKMTVYDYELFDSVDIANLKVGDILKTKDREILITSIDNDDGYIIINQGLENGGICLTSAGGGTYYESFWNDQKSYYEVGEVTLPVGQDFVFEDSSDLENPTKIYYAGDLISEIKDSGIRFQPGGTLVTVQDGFITQMTRVYTP